MRKLDDARRDCKPAEHFRYATLWNIGKILSAKKLEKGHGGKVVEQLSLDLKIEFPDKDGFSSRSLWDMKRFYEFYANEKEKLPRAMAVLLWGHNCLFK